MNPITSPSMEALTRARIREELRWFLVEYLPSQEPNQRRNDSQVGVLLDRLRTLRGFSFEQVQTALDVIMEELNRLFLVGILRPGHEDSFEFPFFSVTAWGRAALEAEGSPVYDPDAYLEHVRRKVPTLPDVAELYLGEAVAAFNLARTLSAAVMLSVAAEAVLVHLIAAFAGSPPASNGERLRRSLQRVPISQTYREFLGQLDPAALPDDLRRDLDVYLGNVLNYIRLTRNEAGHPTGIAVERPVIEAQLRAFEGYAKRLCGVADFFAANHRA